jgi:DNA modification methylase
MGVLMILTSEAVNLVSAINDMEPVSGYTHEFYRYPARFSPRFVRTIIETFTKPGDLIYDPYVGSGTSLVEASLLGRYSVGSDISTLAVFLSRVKTTCLSDKNYSTIMQWFESIDSVWNIHNSIERDEAWINYQKNINNKKTWRIRKLIELVIHYLKVLPLEEQQRFIRCVLLRTAQWALDCRTDVPSVDQFRQQFALYLYEMIEKGKEYADIIHSHFGKFNNSHTVCLNHSVIGIDKNELINNIPKPKLIVTSPPYPGVHVLYHRWQVHSRRETPTPFWIANCLDGNPESYYTMGHRQQKDLVDYFSQLDAAFKSIRNIASKDTMVVQMIAFSNPSWQLEKYLKTMENVGLREIKYHDFSNSSDGRLWRVVPNRKWYANKRAETSSQYEVTLFHKVN